MEINELTGQIIGAAMRVHSAVGPGLLESVYRTCMQYELVQLGLKVQAEFPIPVVYRGVQLDVGYRVDFLVENVVLVELKALTTMLPVHEAQLLSFVRMSNRPVGLLIKLPRPSPAGWHPTRSKPVSAQIDLRGPLRPLRPLRFRS